MSMDLDDVMSYGYDLWIWYASGRGLQVSLSLGNSKPHLHPSATPTLAPRPPARPRSAPRAISASILPVPPMLSLSIASIPALSVALSIPPIPLPVAIPPVVPLPVAPAPSTTLAVPVSIPVPIPVAVAVLRRAVVDARLGTVKRVSRADTRAWDVAVNPNRCVLIIAGCTACCCCCPAAAARVHSGVTAGRRAAWGGRAVVRRVAVARTRGRRWAARG